MHMSLTCIKRDCHGQFITWRVMHAIKTSTYGGKSLNLILMDHHPTRPPSNFIESKQLL